MAPSVDSKEVVVAASADIVNQENVSPKAQTGRQSSKQQVRHRASVACASCRDRRIRCVVPKNHATCTACQRTGADCIIKNDDERRRPISKAYMSSLSDRISMLEGMLLDKGVVPPPAAHPPKTRHDGQSKPTADAESVSSHPKPQNTDGVSPTCDEPSPPDSRNDDFAIPESEHGDPNMTSSQVLQPLAKEESPFRMLDPKQEDIIHRLLSTKGNLSFDQLSGRLRFFGPTANSHVYAETSDQFDTREPPEQVRRAERIIRSFSIETHDYLINQFFAFYNSVLQVIDRSAFEADREAQDNSPKFYSSFLHITILAMGYRVADMDRDDMRKITLAPRESTLHQEAKYMLDIELERPGGIPSVQALLLLGDLECGVGRDNTGWMYSGMANRLAFDIGLHLDCRSNEMPEQECRIRNMAMRACIIYDKYWGLFLGRPLAIKSQDVDLLSNRLSHLNWTTFETPKRDLCSEIYEQLTELMELAGRIVETRDNTVSNNASEQYNLFASAEAEDNAYLHVINLDRQLQNWYRRLPVHLAWKPSNIKMAPYSFFLLHQQYHVTMILLHRPWAKYGSITGDGASTGSHPSPEGNHMSIAPDATSQHAMLATESHSLGMGDPHIAVHDSRTSLSRSICTQQAIRVARIFWQHRQRYDGRKIFVTGIQHAGTASLALIAALAYQRSEADRRTYVGYLEILSDAVGDMSHTYHPASRMDDLLKAVLEQIRNSMGEPPRPRSGSTSHHGFAFNGHAGSALSAVSLNSDSAASMIPLRREAADPEFVQPFKKRRPEGSRRASEFTRPRPHFFSAQAHPTPPSSRKSQLGNSLNAQNHSPLDSFLFSMGVGDTSGQLNMDFLGGTTIDMDQPGDTHEGVMGRMDDMDLAIPSSETWGLDGVHDHHLNGPGPFDPPTIDWTSGPAGLSASSVLGQSAAISSGIMSGAPNFGMGKHTGDLDNKTLGSTTDGKDSTNPSKIKMDGEEWMEDGSNIGAISPASLNGFVQGSEKVSNGDDGSTGGNRNHSLDFFSFS
ncbi:fungal-specific transcription factor domain-containing protein [Dactylonectria estremocensis]|uniref:Fungal-specific transcription factor domain-containing protein n=1 Tax=Dactylonectria estremocensis TaxID=1079267 RepID=A0A9P9E9S4_9HYPO|nr:fungal-specific transcription factor domain-containing protein [Dactylonectria estremocensis]